MKLDTTELLNYVLKGDKGTQEERLEEAIKVYKQFSSKAEQTLTAPPSLEQRELDLKFGGRKDQQMIERETALQQIRDQANAGYADIGNKAYGSRMGTYADTFNQMQAPTLAEMAAGRTMRDDTHRYLIDKNFENDAADRELRQQAIKQQGRGQIFDLIKTLGLGGAILLSK